jgi:hypothetical protein
VVPAAPAASDLQQKLEACDDDSVFTAPICRLRACAGHWGDDPACVEAKREGSGGGR